MLEMYTQYIWIGVWGNAVIRCQTSGYAPSGYWEMKNVGQYSDQNGYSCQRSLKHRPIAPYMDHMASFSIRAFRGRKIYKPLFDGYV